MVKFWNRIKGIRSSSMSSVLNKMIKVSLIEKVTFNQTLEVGEQLNLRLYRGRDFQVEGAAGAPVLWQQCVWCALRLRKWLSPAERECG